MKTKAILLLLTLPALAFTTSCNSCNEDDDRKYEVMQLYGGWKARADETREVVQHIENHYREYTRYDFDSTDLRNYSTEYPYWEEVRTYTDENGLRKVHVLADNKRNLKEEKFYFKEDVLVLAEVLDAENDSSAYHKDKGIRYFFVDNTLVLVLSPTGERMDIENAKIRTRSIDLLQESKQLRTIVNKRNITY